ncbi:hypothetical protein DXG01_005733 [Tephrocybe rancida]|nr:hypothetical protein DXG01_005733 [Tephrocybe rancida]
MSRALYNLGLTAIPIVNVNNNCSTGSAALYQANNTVKYGQAECSLALGFERMKPGSLGTNFPDREPPTMIIGARSTELEQEGLGQNHGPGAPRMFGNGAQEYFGKYGGNIETLAKIASKNHKHSLNNPYSQFRDGWSVEQVLNAPKITNQLTKFMCSPTSDGAACCIVASEDFVHKHRLENQAIEIVAQALTTDSPVTFEGRSAMDVVGYTMSKTCADKVFKEAGFADGEGRDQVGVVELHDCFAANEVLIIAFEYSWELNSSTSSLHIRRLVSVQPMKPISWWSAGTILYVDLNFNPSGGLEAKGHPLGATGLGMHFYIMMQLRNWAGPMQAPGLFNTQDSRGKFGLVHNVGLGGAVVVSLLRRPEFFKPGGVDGRTRVGYNHAHECRPVTLNDVNKVKSVQSSNSTNFTQPGGYSFGDLPLGASPQRHNAHFEVATSRPNATFWLGKDKRTEHIGATGIRLVKIFNADAVWLLVQGIHESVLEGQECPAPIRSAGRELDETLSATVPDCLELFDLDEERSIVLRPRFHVRNKRFLQKG